jgi:hypothetical protein
VRLFTRRGHDWSKRYPAIVRTAAALRCTSFTLDGEGRSLRSGWRRDLRRAPPPRRRQRGYAVRLRPSRARRRGPSGHATGRPQEEAGGAPGKASDRHPRERVSEASAGRPLTEPIERRAAHGGVNMTPGAKFSWLMAAVVVLRHRPINPRLVSRRVPKHAEGAARRRSSPAASAPAGRPTRP